jgi:hypothetical protein
MTRLDAEERVAMRERVVEGVPPADAVRYLRELGPTWEAADGGTGRQMLAQALFERVEVRGFREVTLRLTDAALAHGFGAVLPERVGMSVSGRGERSRAHTSQLIVRIDTGNVPRGAHIDEPSQSPGRNAPPEPEVGAGEPPCLLFTNPNVLLTSTVLLPFSATHILRRPAGRHGGLRAPTSAASLFGRLDRRAGPMARPTRRAGV